MPDGKMPSQLASVHKVGLPSYSLGSNFRFSFPDDLILSNGWMEVCRKGWALRGLSDKDQTRLILIK